MKSYVEHANIVVVDPEHTIHLLTAAAPDWQVRGSGVMDNWFGKTVTWYHVGTEDTYVTIQGGGEGEATPWTSHLTGLKHLGIVVENLDEAIQRLEEAGYSIDHFGGDHPHRKSAYYVDKHGLEFEFVEYFSERPEERNDYTL
ncbi:VOC family protein [Thaumasiovibrio subtropicus]|uniref:VOC family protein n=1 Tax=Thaumasiovibrio subtropicus TaxID=1891207 RepID=UPI000B35D7A6|nr:VOC family protein [Thaumasiovibrio subtropicus]